MTLFSDPGDEERIQRERDQALRVTCAAYQGSIYRVPLDSERDRSFPWRDLLTVLALIAVATFLGWVMG